MKKTTAISLLFIIYAQIVCRVSFAQPDTAGMTLFDLSIEELMNIEVTVNKIGEKAFEASGTVYVITAQEIQLKGYKDLKDLLVELPGVGFSGYTGDVDMTRVRVRGINENMKILVIRDGIKLNNPSGIPLTWGNNIPLHDIEQIEIVIGPGTVIYGQNTYSALVNLKSKKSKHISVESGAGSYKTYVPAFSFSEPTKKGYVFLSGRCYFSEGYNRYKEYPEIYKDAVDQWSVKVQNSDNFFDSRDLMTNAFVQDANAHLEYKHGKFIIGGMYSDLKEVNSLPHNPELYFVNHLSPIRVVQYQGYTKYITEIGEKWKSQSTATYIQEIRGFEYGFTYLDDPKAYDPGDKKYFNAFDADLRLEHQMIYTPLFNLKVNFGGIFEDITSVPQETHFFSQIDPSTRINDSTTYRFQNYGFFTQANWKPFHWLRFVGGARIDYNTDYKETFNPRAALIFYPAEHLTLKAMHGSAYLAPSSKELFFVNPAPHSTQIASPDLNPQRIRTEELSGEYRVNENVSVQANLFYNHEFDIVALVLISTDSTQTPPFQTRQNQNINQIESYGGEFIVKATVWNKLRISAWYSYVDGETHNYSEKLDDIQINSLIQIANHKGNISLTYLPVKQFGIHLNTHFMGRIKTNDLNEKYQGGFMPAVMNMDLNLSALQLWKHVDIELRVRNILNQKQFHLETRGYDIRLPEVPQPLMNFLLTFRYNI